MRLCDSRETSRYRRRRRCCCCGAPARDAAWTRQPRRCVRCAHAIRTRRGTPPPAQPSPRNSHNSLTFLMCMHAPLRLDGRTFLRRDSRLAAMRCAGACFARVPFECAVARRRPPLLASALPISPPSIHPMFDAPLMGPCQAPCTRLHVSSLTHHPLSAQASTRTSRVGAQGPSGGGRAATDRACRRRSRGPARWAHIMGLI